MSDGNGQSKELYMVDTFDNDKDHALFKPGSPPPLPENIPLCLENTFCQWLERHPDRVVRTTLGIVCNGFTVAIHVFYDTSSSE